MFTIKKEMLAMAFVGLVALASLLGFVIKSNVTYVIYIIIAAMLPLFFYINNDVKFKKKEGMAAMLVLAALFLTAMAQYLFSFYNIAFRPKTVWLSATLIYFGWILLFIKTLKYGEIEGGKEVKLDKKTEMLIVFGVFCLALFLRLFMLDSIPLGVWYDEAQNGTEVIKMLGEEGLKVFIPETTQMPTLFFYLALVSVKIFGINIFALKFISVLFGALCSTAFYFLLRVVFSDIRLAIAGAFLIAASRWHLIFSRVAFLGMLTIFFEITVFYYYLKMLKGKNFVYGMIAGAAAGLSAYAFSASYFIPIAIAVHAIVVMFEDIKTFFRYHLRNYFLLFLAAGIIAMPLFLYAVNHQADFFQRSKDVSIMNEIIEKKSFSPILHGLKIYALSFNFEGDYNGRHNLYKRQHLDEITGVLFLLGVFLSFFRREYRFFTVWFGVMLLPGLMTVTVEAPQAYRISAVIPAVIALALIAVDEIRKALFALVKKQRIVSITIGVLVACTCAISIVQYFVVYPKEISAFMDFSPEANGISRFVNSNSNEYYILVSPVEKEYAFHAIEQKVILGFTTHGKGRFDYMQAVNKAGPMQLTGKKGAVVIVRASDEEYITALERYYPDARKETAVNNFRGNTLYIIYYIDIDKIVQGTETILYR